MGLTPPSLTSWVSRLKHDRVLAALIGCPLHSLPPLGSYFDFMNRLWTAPSSDLYSRKKLLPASWNSKKPEKPKGKGQKAAEAKPKITAVIANRVMDGTAGQPFQPPESYLHNAELYEEGQTGNYNMLDGNLNNEPPELPDLTDGQSYEEIRELAPEMLPKEKPSLMERLKADRPEHEARQATPPMPERER